MKKAKKIEISEVIMRRYFKRYSKARYKAVSYSMNYWAKAFPIRLRPVN